MTSVTPSVIESTLPTGIDVLDDRLGGGFYPGSIVAFLANPISQSELLLARLTRERPTLYLTLERDSEAVRHSLSRAGADLEGTSIVPIGTADPLDDALQAIEARTEPTTVVVDPMNAVESLPDERLWTFLNAAQAHLVDVGGLLVLHCLTGDRPPRGRATTEYMADVVFELETDYYGESVENRLLVPKFRGGVAIQQAIKLELTDDVAIDTSREIA